MQGFEDLRRGIIRTPLPPEVTFLDDPLRMLRAIRFSSRFSFPMHDDILAAMRVPGIVVRSPCSPLVRRVGAGRWLASGVVCGYMCGVGSEVKDGGWR